MIKFQQSRFVEDTEVRTSHPRESYIYPADKSARALRITENSGRVVKVCRSRAKC